MWPYWQEQNKVTVKWSSTLSLCFSFKLFFSLLSWCGLFNTSLLREVRQGKQERRDKNVINHKSFRTGTLQHHHSSYPSLLYILFLSSYLQLSLTHWLSHLMSEAGSVFYIYNQNLRISQVVFWQKHWGHCIFWCLYSWEVSSYLCLTIPKN